MTAPWSGVLITLVVLVTACGATERETTTTTRATTTTGATPATTSTTLAVPAAGHLVKLEPDTLEPVAGLTPIPMTTNSWNMLSPDQSLLLNVDWHGEDQGGPARVYDLVNWREIGIFELGPHSGRAFNQTTFFGYDSELGHLFAVDIRTGHRSALAEWPRGLWLWDDLHILSGSRLAALGSGPSDVVENQTHHSIYLYDPSTEETRTIPVGPIERWNERTGVYDGDYEIPEIDSPGVAWSGDRVYLVHADEPEVTEVDLVTGTTETHFVESSAWWQRVWAFWMPSALAKGPSLGTNSSAAVSPDGRFLFISGNRYAVNTGDRGNLIEENEHLGLTVVDTETWHVVPSPDLPIQYVRNSQGSVVGVDTLSTQPWIDDYYLLSIDEGGSLTSLGPFEVGSGGCESTPDQARLVCTEPAGIGSNVRAVDVESGEAVAEIHIGQEDVLHSNGILEDWKPQNNP